MVPLACLYRREPNGAETAIPLTQPVTVIGRAAGDGVDCGLDDPSISGRHARIRRHDGGWLIEDLGSTNGTRVGDQLLRGEAAPLVSGATVVLGTVTLRFMAPRPAFVTVAAPGEPAELTLDRPRVRIGREPDNEIVIASPRISRTHAEIRQVNGGFELVDLASSNGTFVQGQRVQQHRLADGDVVALAGEFPLTFHAAQTLDDAPATVFMRAQPAAKPSEARRAPAVGGPPMRAVALAGRNALTIGRDAQNDVALDSPQVSRHHARLERTPEGWLLRDLGSTNHTYVEGRAVASHALRDGQAFRIGPWHFRLVGDRLEQYDDRGNLYLEAFNLTTIVGRHKAILQDVTLAVPPGEFVALIGGSGAGKTTLLGALNGFRPATKGRVLLNGVDLYRDFDAFRSLIGYVPQDDIIHRELTVETTLRYAARLRLPEDTSPIERERRIADVLAELFLSEHRLKRVSQLSGGQRKRVSIGVELLTRPTLFFLDEPTSGLDPGTEAHMMALLRDLSRQGRTIILVTHATKNIRLCDQVVFMARGGRLAYFGPPEAAVDYFGVKEFEDIYDELERERTPEQWEARYRDSPLYREQVARRLIHTKPEETAAVRAASPPKRSGWRQFATLTSRYFNVLRSDTKNLAILLAQAPLLAILTTFLVKPDIFARPPTAPGNPFDAVTLLVILAAVAVWLGGINAAREICKEAPIYARERRTGLGALPYVGSKFVVLAGLCLLQVLVLFAIVTFRIPLPDLGQPQTFLANLAFLETLFLATLTACCLGLLVSALVANPDRATSVIPILMIPQIMFAGGLFPLSQLGWPAQVISAVVPARWAFEALGRSVELLQHFDLVKPAEAARFDPAFVGSVALPWLALVALSMVFFGLALYFQRRKG